MDLERGVCFLSFPFPSLSLPWAVDEWFTVVEGEQGVNVACVDDDVC